MIINGLERAGGVVRRNALSQLVEVNDEFTLSLVIARCRQTPAGTLRWRLRFETSLKPDITVAVRMDSANRQPFDYYLLPRIDFLGARLNLAESNVLQMDAYRFDSLDLLFDLARQTSVPEAA